MIARLRTLGLFPAFLVALTLTVAAGGCETKRTNPFDPDNPDKPDDVFELTVQSEGLALRLNWKALEQPVQEYRVYKLEVLGAGASSDGQPADGAEKPEAHYAVVTGSSSTLLDEAIIVGGAKYHYWVTAFHATYGESPPSRVAVYDAMEDLDADGYDEDDCIDNDASVNPGAIDLCDEKDNNCDGNIDEVSVDLDGDGAVSSDCAGGTDCNDSDARIHPGASEICDGKDNDCDGRIDAADDDYAGDDSDGDGHDGTYCGGDDCDDGDATVHPGAPELCDGKDNDCDGATDADDDDMVGGDSDGDGYRSGLCGGDDCDDVDAATHPGAPEVCDGKDNDCDGLIDGEDEDLQGGDGDGDGHAGTACGGDDCDDGDAATYPGAAEICDGKDNNCDGDVPANERDADGDGFKGCEGDCDDDEAAARPGAAELCGDGIDNDCDGFTDNVDLDGDGHVDEACGGDDCNDADGSVNPGANEICGNGVDDNCNGDVDEQDADNDSFDSAGCGGDDCDDNDPNVHPGAEEICDGKDSNCDGVLPADEQDADGDGVRLCDGDCHDFDPDVHPGADEVCDGRDNDCNGETDEVPIDADQDGYVSSACPGGDDCHDGDDAINPGADEVCGDGVDNDCSGEVDDLDADDDGYVAEACGGNDCNDDNDTINPGANEICGNTVDDNCNGQIDEQDADGDGHDSDACGGDDCNDNDDTVYPGADEICDMQDNDCDTEIDENQKDADDDGHVDIECLGGTDCDDSNDQVRPGAAEQCGDEVDQDCSGDPDDKDADGDTYIDEACGGDDCNDDDNTINPDMREICGDGIDQDCSGTADDKDEDGDGHIDAACTGGDDCEDDDDSAYPGAPETCGDGVDNDCNGTPDDKDADGDTYVDSTCLGGTDCNDGNADVHPGALDICGNQIDDDCNGVIDDTDADGDGYIDDQCGGDDCDDDNINVNPGQNEDCSTPYDDNCNGTINEGDADNDGHDSIACDGDDCDDNNENTYPGADEICDGKDNDCDTEIDEGCDDDHDGYCDADLTLVGEPPICPHGGNDCDDGNENINPGALELCGNGVDEDCSGSLDDRDADDDGYIAEVCGGDDCNDLDDSVYPDAPEACDGRDNDCDGDIDEDPTDFDNDGYISERCGGGDDCDDFDPDVNPDAEEVCDGVDNDCNGAIDDRDGDSDGFIASACGGDDCDDDNDTINPAAAEICGNSVDENCSGVLDDKDADRDGYKDDSAACGGDGDDCDDDNPDVNPGQNEDCSTPYDDNCNGTVNEGDADGDGYDSLACDGDDCDDNDAEVHPGAEEICDGKDNNCDGRIDEVATDADGDGYVSDMCGGGRDCDDSDPDVNPGETEICGNQVDEDCSGELDDLDADHDGYVAEACGGDDCDDLDDEVNPGEWEECGDGKNNDCQGGVDDMDNDGDGHINPMCGGDDCDDYDANTYPGATEICDGRDNDCDGALAATELDGDGDGAAPCVEVACEGMARVLTVTDSWTWSELNEFIPVVSRNSVHADIEAWDGTNPSPDGFDVVLFADGGRRNGPGDLEPRPFSDRGAAALKAFVEDGGGLVLLEFAALRERFDGPRDLENLGLFDPGPIDEYWANNWNWFLHAPAHPLAANVPDHFGGPRIVVAPNAQARPGTTVIYSADPGGPVGGTPLLLAGLRGSGRVAHFNMTGCDGTETEPFEGMDMIYLLFNALDWTNQCHGFRGNDCDDSDPLVHPGATEFCDGEDNDCDTLVDMADPDLQAVGGDGDGDGHVGELCDAAGDDCDDTNDAVHPGAPEVCDALDNDCDTAIDGDDNSGNPSATAPYYVGDDADGDGFEGPCGSTVIDCDDNDDSVYPGAPELCDGKDNDCDGLVDMADPDMQMAPVPGDGDGDGTAGTLCGGTDCNDTDPAIGPHAEEICGDGIDNDCSGRDGDKDADDDGFIDDDAACANGDDCNDDDPSVNPGALEICFSGVDEDCSGAENDRDADGDGEIDENCGGPDCDDTNEDVNTQALEVCDGADNNCDGQLDAMERDDDGDGFAECLSDCAFQAAPYIWIPVPHDNEFRLHELCGDDSYEEVNLPFDFPLFDELYSRVFVSTNGFLSFDWDGAESGSNLPIPSTADPDGLIAAFWDDLMVDCGMLGGSVYAGWGGTAPNRYLAVEWDRVWRDGTSDLLTFQIVLFENGNAWLSYQMLSPGNPASLGASATVGIESMDGRRGTQYSYNTASLSAGTTIALACGTDCDDTSDAVSPAAAETCNGEDTNCDGTIDNKDADSDGHIDENCTGGTDCNDDDFSISPDGNEICGDGIDNDCSGQDGDKDSDGDGFVDDDPLCLNGTDCDDEDSAFNPDAPEICDGEDNDCDGQLGALEQDNDGDGFAGCTLVCDREAKVLVVADSSSGPAIRNAALRYHPPGEGPSITVVQIGSWDTVVTPASDFDVVVFADGGLLQNEPEINPLAPAELQELSAFGIGGGGLVLFELTAMREHRFGQEALAALGLFEVPSSPDWTDDGPLWTVTEGHPVTENLPTTFWPRRSVWFRDASAKPGTTEVIRAWDTPAVLVQDRGISGRTVHVNLAGHNGFHGFTPFDDGEIAALLESAIGWANQCGSFKANDCDDADDTAFPGAPEYCDGKDNDCDGYTDEINDGDHDGHKGILCGGDDCDDSNDRVYTGAPEICDGIDNDCDALIDTADPDLSDGDGDGDGVAGLLCGGTDCDDGNPNVYPGADELCDGIDNDCDMLIDMNDPDLQSRFGDGDGDGFAGVLCGGDDCDDTSAEIRPGAPEVCGDGIDNDCSGQDGDKDADNDGHIDGDPACLDGDDCDDDEPTTNPGAPEICGDGVDNDCSGIADDKDADGDGQIDENCGGLDCDDDNPATYTGATEICDLEDNDCDGSPAADETDDDHDGFVECEPGLVETDWRWMPTSQGPDLQGWGAGWLSFTMSFGFPFFGEAYDRPYITSNGTVSFFDEDLYSDNRSIPFSPPPYTLLAPFWDALHADYDPEQGLFRGSGGTAPDRYHVFEWRNFTGDEFGAELTFQLILYESGEFFFSYQTLHSNEPPCEPGGGGGGGGGGGAVEMCIDAFLGESATVGFQNFDGSVWAQYSYNQPVLREGLTLTYVPGGDCDDNDDTVYPGAPELCDGKDNDCNTVIDDKDTDGDGFVDGDPICGGTDCNDADEDVNPDAEEICGDGIDNDCSGQDNDRDEDSDTYIDDNPLCGGDDCDDNDPDKHPNATERCNGEDDDCDGSLGPLETDDDGDGYVECDLSGAHDPEILVLADSLNQPEIRNALNSRGLTATERLIGSWDTAALPASSFDVIVFADGINQPGGSFPMPAMLTPEEITALTGFAASGGGLVLFEVAGGRISVPPFPNGQDLGALPLFELDLSSFSFNRDDDWRVMPGMEGHPVAQNLGTGWFYLYDVMMGNTVTYTAPDAQHLIQTMNAPIGVLVRDQGAGGNRTVHFNLAGAHESMLFGSSNPFTDENVRTLLENAVWWTNQTGVFLGNDCDDTDDEVYPGAPEICDGKDNDCDTLVDDLDPDVIDDFDNDTFVEATYCGGADCDDTDPNVNPAATEVCDGIDNNCLDGIDEVKDGDNDTYDGIACGGADCDDTDPEVNPGAAEICDGIDNNCVDGIDEVADGDGDTFDGIPCGGADCDDGDDQIHPNATEVCDDVDNNCDGQIDEGCDDDADGYCDDGMTVVGNPASCPNGGGDCDDDEANSNPGATEICDGKDNDCVDGIPTDEQDGDMDGFVACDAVCGPLSVLIIGEGGTGAAEVDLAPALGSAGFFVQVSSVSYTDYTGEFLDGKDAVVLAPDITVDQGSWDAPRMNSTGRSVLANWTAAGGVLVPIAPAGVLDLDDWWFFPAESATGTMWPTSATLHRPSVESETFYAGLPFAFPVDGPWFEFDLKASAEASFVDGDDDPALMNTEHFDGFVFQSGIGGALTDDGYDLHPFRDQPALMRWLTNRILDVHCVFGGDCVTVEGGINPGAIDVCGDGVDNDCSGEDDEVEDVDLDGFDASACGGNDCDDLAADINPEQIEICGDPDDTDEDCSGAFDDLDLDSDGHYDYRCTGGDDCNDADPNTNPAASEICDGVDNNCDTTLPADEQDLDEDGYMACTPAACTMPAVLILGDGRTELDIEAELNSWGIADVTVGPEQRLFDGTGYLPGDYEVAILTDGGYMNGDQWTMDDMPAAGQTWLRGFVETNGGALLFTEFAGFKSFGSLFADLDDFLLLEPRGGGGTMDFPGPLQEDAVHPIVAKLDWPLTEPSSMVLDGETTELGTSIVQSNLVSAGVDVPFLAVGFRNGDGPFGHFAVTGTPPPTVGSYQPFAPGSDTAMLLARAVAWLGDCPIVMGGDCEDGDPAIHPDAIDICDTINNDCDGETDEDDDFDADGFTAELCGGLDCDDTDDQVNPNAIEVCDGKDNDCNGQTDTDDPGLQTSPEVCGDGIDNDCDGGTDNKDNDSDGDLDEACGGTDCDDDDPTVNGFATEYCDDKDNNCNGQTDEGFESDLDNDGYIADCTRYGGSDCNDGNPMIHPNATELCNGLDDNCDGQIDEGCDLDSDPLNCGGCGAVCDLFRVAANICSGGACAIDTMAPNNGCEPGWSNDDGDPANGCEVHACSPTGAEICDDLGTDEDCNGDVNENEWELAGGVVNSFSVEQDGIHDLALERERDLLVTVGPSWSTGITFRVWDVSDRANPMQRGGLHDSDIWSPQFVDVEGDLALVGAHSYYWALVDIGDPDNPRVIYRNTDSVMFNYAGGLDLANGYAYIPNCDESKVQVWDVRNPLAPRHVGDADLSGSGTPTDPADVLAVGDRLYVTTGNTSFHVFDISNKANPVEIQGILSGVHFRDVKLSQQIAYLGHYEGDYITAVDLRPGSTPEPPLFQAMPPMGGDLWHVAVDRNLFYVLGEPSTGNAFVRVYSTGSVLSGDPYFIDTITLSGALEYARRGEMVSDGQGTLYLGRGRQNDTYLDIIQPDPQTWSTPCAAGLGECRRVGSWTCGPGGLECGVTPGDPQPEVCDTLDNDCDGQTDNKDTDGDGFIDQTMPCMGSDCDDNDITVNPMAMEVCDDKDNNCDGQTDENVNPDMDGDGHTADCTTFGGDDCNDANPFVFTGAPELCNGIDDNCNTVVDEGFLLQTDPQNCGGCGNVCDLFGVAPGAHLCVDGSCEIDDAQANGGCLPGWQDLDTDPRNGCEATLPCMPSGGEKCDNPGVDEDCNTDVNENEWQLNPQIMAQPNIPMGMAYDLAIDTDRDLLVAVGEPDMAPLTVFQIYDISDPTNPQTRGSLTSNDFMDSLRYVAVENTLAIVVKWSGLFSLVDISDPDNPSIVLQNSMDWIGWPGEGDIALSGGFAYLPNQDPEPPTVDIFDVRNPTQPLRVARTRPTMGDPMDPPLSVVVQGDRLYYTTDTYDSLHVYDVSDPTSPVELAIALSGEQVREIAVADQIAWATANDGDEIWAVDLRGAGDLDPPVYNDSDDGDYYRWQIAIDDNLVYVLLDNVSNGYLSLEMYTANSITTANPTRLRSAIFPLNTMGTQMEQSEMVTDGNGTLYFIYDSYPSQLIAVQPNPAIWMGPCSEGEGICRDTGVWNACGEGMECSATPGTPEEEVCGDSLDNDCNGAVDDRDNDGDGYISADPGCGGDDCCDEGTEPVPGCEPAFAHDIHPDAPENCNNRDDDCSGIVDDPWDQDGDGHFIAADCHVGDGDDCDDTEPRVYLDAPEYCDGLDNDCDGEIDANDVEFIGDPPYYLGPDADNDGHDAEFCSGDDCDDLDDEIYPGHSEDCDGKDNNCNGMTDEGCGPKCYSTYSTCPTNTTCFAYAGNTDGVGECFLSSNENLQMGEACEGNDDCQSGICGGHMVPSICNDICTTDRHCDPIGLKCYLDYGRSSDGRLGGMCGVDQGPFSIGDPCSTPDSCESNTCLPYTQGMPGENYCSDLCCENGDCPPGYFCTFWNAGEEEHFKACTDMNDFLGGIPGSKQLGENCTSEMECQSGYCGFGQCIQPCCEDDECAPSQFCDLVMYGPTMVMMCQPDPGP